MQPVAEKIFTEPIQTQAKVFPTANTNLYKILNDPEHKKSFHAQLKRYNPFVVGFYRVGLLPLFGVSKTVMLLTTPGNVSGRLRTTPIGYFRIGGIVYLFSAWGKGTGWYKNMAAHPNEVWIQIGLHKRAVRPAILKNPLEIQSTIEKFLKELPSEAKHLFGWEPGYDTMETADFSKVIEKVLIVRFEEKPG